MGAAGTQGRGPLGRGHVHGAEVRLPAQDPLPQQLGVQLVQGTGKLLTHAGDAGGLDLVLHKRLQLLDDIELLHPGGKVPDQVHGQGEGQAQLQEGGPLREHLLCVFIGDGGGDHAHLAVAHFQLVQAVFQGTGAAVFSQLLQALLYDGMVGIGVGRGAHELADVAGIGGVGVLPALTELHQALGVTDPGGGAVQHRRVEQLGHLAGQGHEVLALLGVAGLHHGDLGGPGIVAVVLLILGGMTAGVVGGDHDERPAHAHVTGGEQGVGGHVQAHHLHGAEGTGTGDGRAVGHLGGHLLVGGPLAVYVVLILGQIFQNFRAGGAGIGGTDFDPGLIDAPCGGLVAGHQMLHGDLLPFYTLFLHLSHTDS